MSDSVAPPVRLVEDGPGVAEVFEYRLAGESVDHWAKPVGRRSKPSVRRSTPSCSTASKRRGRSSTSGREMRSRGHPEGSTAWCPVGDER